MANFPNEARTPTAATFEELFRYYFNETERRAEESVRGLSNAELDRDPGQGSWSIGMLLKHQLDLLRLIAENMEPGSASDIPKADIGEEGNWRLDVILAQRAVLAARVDEVFGRTNPDVFMEKRPGVYPHRWEEWPALMRVMRPLIDIATHVGQVNYARRQLGKPVGI